MQLFKKQYAHLFSKICSYLKKNATIMHLCKLDSLKELV